MGEESIRQGRFIYKVSKKVDTISLMVDGLPINEESVKKHIQKGKFYLLFMSPMNSDIIGVRERTTCSKKMEEKFGFTPYYIGHCIPGQYYKEQIRAYNNYVISYLKKNKNLPTENDDALESQYYHDIYKCSISEQMDKENLGNGKTQKEFWEEVVRKYKKLPEISRSTDSITFWYNHIRMIHDISDTVDIKSLLTIAETEGDYLTKHGLIWSCFVLVNWRNNNNLDEQIINRIDNVAKDVQSKYPDKNKIPNLDPWYSHYEAFKVKFKKE